MSVKMSVKKKHLTSTRDLILDLIRDHGRMTSTQVSDALGVTASTASYYLDSLRKAGQLVSHGRGANGGFDIAPYKSPAASTDDDLKTPEVFVEQKILNLLADADSALTAGKIADEIGVTISAAKNRLYRMRRAGQVTGKRAGPNKGYSLPTKKSVKTPTWTVETNVEQKPFKQEDVDHVAEQVKSVISSITEFDNISAPVVVDVDMFDKVRHLSFPVATAALALLGNDVVTAKRMLELT